MRKRGRRKVNWFPTLGTESGFASDIAGFDFNIPTSAVPPLGIFPITYDEPQSEVLGSSDTPLVDIVGSEYIIKRLVGKIFLGLETSNASLGSAYLIGCGFFVARAEDPPNQAGPIGYATEAATQRLDNYGPLRKRTIREPWIWRRTWILGTGPRLAGTGVFALDTYPPTNTQYSGLGDGPHIDAKSARRVGNDDRLWFAVEAIPYPGGSTDQIGTTIQGYLDLRVLGSLVKAHNRSVF